MASATTKFLALSALFLVLLSAVHGTIYRTIVTTTETITNDEAGSSSEEERCRLEVQQQPLDSCRSYLQSGQESLLMVRGRSNRGSVPQQCCQQIENLKKENLKTDCTCYALKYLVRELQQERQEQEQGRGQGQGQERGDRYQRELVRRALQIPLECNLEARSCRISED